MADLNVTVTHNFGKVNAVFGADAEVAVSREFKRAMRRAGKILQTEVVRGYSGYGREGWSALHPFTIEQKGFDLLLIRSGALADHVVTLEDAYSVAVGFVDPEQAKKALIHENGALVPCDQVSPKGKAVRAFLASRGFFLRKETTVLLIPPRPNFANALGAVLPKLADLFTKAIASYYAKKVAAAGGP